MNNNIFNNHPRRFRLPSWRTALLFLLMSAFLQGCYVVRAGHDFNRTGVAPWWCKGTPDLAEQDCKVFSISVDIAVIYAHQYPTRAEFVTTGATVPALTPANIGAALVSTPVATAFDFKVPNMLMYSGTASTDRLVGYGWVIDSVAAPAGYAGSRDVWVQDANTGYWVLSVWAIRGHENQADIFAATHPCLTATGSTLTATTDACFLASHPMPFDVMVTNDDGVLAEGIDALVEGLYGLPNINIQVVAPAANQSGSGDATTPPPFVVSGTAATTLSGRVATAVNSTDPADAAGSGSPADAVLFGLNSLNLSPEVVLSGINDGQNLATIGSGLSGTVGAARTAIRQQIDAISTSQGGVTVTPDFPAGVAGTLALLEEWRLGKAGKPFMTLPNINIPSCGSGLSPQGTVETVVGVDLSGGAYFGPQDCLSTQTTFVDDLNAFVNGYISIADMGQDLPPNYP